VFDCGASGRETLVHNSVKKKCTRCKAEILAITADYCSGMCDPCYRLARTIAWRRSWSFIWFGFARFVYCFRILAVDTSTMGVGMGFGVASSVLGAQLQATHLN
jgi:hypothetical protein